MTVATSGGASAAAAIAQAIKASGAIVRVEPQDFMSILARSERPLVVAAKGGFLDRSYKYLTSYKGLAFFTKSAEPLTPPVEVDWVVAKRIWIPG